MQMPRSIMKGAEYESKTNIIELKISKGGQGSCGGYQQAHIQEWAYARAFKHLEMMKENPS